VARAREVSGLDCEQPFAKAAARTVEVRSAEVFERSKGVLDLDKPKRVHDMRVATRRLRAALEIFAPCFPPKRHGKALKEVKRLADALGERRDRDVAIASLEEMKGGVSAGDREAFDDLIGRLQGERRQANDALAGAVKPKRLRRLRRRLERLAEAAER